MYYPGPHPTRADIAAFVLQTEQRQHCAPNSCFRIRSFICDKISQVSENIIHLYFNTLFFIQKRVSFRELLLLIFYCRVIFNNRAAPAVNSPSTFNTTMLLHSSSGGGKGTGRQGRFTPREFGNICACRHCGIHPGTCRGTNLALANTVCRDRVRLWYRCKFFTWLPPTEESQRLNQQPYLFSIKMLSTRKSFMLLSHTCFIIFLLCMVLSPLFGVNYIENLEMHKVDSAENKSTSSYKSYCKWFLLSFKKNNKLLH